MTDEEWGPFLVALRKAVQRRGDDIVWISPTHHHYNGIHNLTTFDLHMIDGKQ